MKVKELLEKLRNMPQDADVIGVTNHYEMRGEIVELIGIRLDTFLKVRKPFRDMMDRTDYESEVYEYDKNGERCVELLM